MKDLLGLLALVLIVVAALATPVSVVHGVYVWVVDDIEFKAALWEGVKLWMVMLSSLIVGFPLYIATKL